MKYSVLTLSFITLLGLQDLNAQARKYSNEFLAIGVSARALGMANATVASVEDVTSGYWNPAGLNYVENNLQVGLMHAEYFAGIAKYDYGAVAIPTKDHKRTLGFSIIRFGVDDIPYTLFLKEPDGTINYDNISSFSIADYAFVFSYAQPIAWKNLKVGANLKVVHRVAGSFAHAWGFGLDAGAQLDLKPWKFGVMLRDVTTTYNAWSFSFTDEEQAVFAQTNNVIPENSYELTLPKAILGAAYSHKMGEKFGITAEVNFDVSTDGKRNVLISADPLSIDPHMGVELNYNEFVYLRGGVGNIQKALSDVDNSEIYTLQPNLGVGLKLKNILIDYAYTDIGNQSQTLYSHVFSLRLDINRSEKPQ